MVSPYAPYRDGIAAFAVQSVLRLNEDGLDVEVLSPSPSAAHHYLDLAGWRGPLALAKRVRRYDEVIIQYHPDVFYPLGARVWERLAITLGLIIAFVLARRIEVRIHEIDYSEGRRPGPDALLKRVLWRVPEAIGVHTETERARLIDSFGVADSRIQIVDHGRDFVRRTNLDKDSARKSLGIPTEVFMFLSIGFIQPHKGFDRAIKAFGDLGERGCRLYVVGSVRSDEPDYFEYLSDLKDLASTTTGVTVVDQYLPDEEFDRWIVAADALVLPYRFIWSSGVRERAALYDRSVIATNVGGLAQQRPVGLVAVEDDAELAEAMRQAAGPLSPLEFPKWESKPSLNRDQVMDEVRSRAEARRGGLPRRPSGDTPVRSPSTEPLRRLPPLGPPAPRSERPFVGLVKRLVRKITAWEIDPLVAHTNALRRAVIDALDEHEKDETRKEGPE